MKFLRAKHFVHQIADKMQVLITRFAQNTSRIRAADLGQSADGLGGKSE